MNPARRAPFAALFAAAALACRPLSGTYTHVVFILPADWPCDWNGLGDIGGQRVYVKATTA